MSSMAVPLVAPPPGVDPNRNPVQPGQIVAPAPGLAPPRQPLGEPVATTPPAIVPTPMPVSTAPASMVPASQQLSRNPMLPQHPLGAYTDAQYEAQNAILRANIAKSYADLLQQLGYTDENGNFVQGSVETNARQAESGLRRSADLATQDVTNQHQQLGTLFSGLRGTDQARAEYPYVNQIADIETQTPLTLQGLFEKAGGLISDYTLQQNQLLADAADRRAQGLASSGGGAGGDAGSSSTPPAGPPAQQTVDGVGIPNMDDAFSGIGGGTSALGPAGGTNWIYQGAPPTVGSQLDPAHQAIVDAASSAAGFAPQNSMVAPPPPAAAPAPSMTGILSATQKKLLNNQMLG